MHTCTHFYCPQYVHALKPAVAAISSRCFPLLVVAADILFVAAEISFLAAVASFIAAASKISIKHWLLI